MTDNPYDYRRALERSFSPDLMKALVLAIHTGYRVAPEHCKRHFDRPDQHDMVGMVRRGKIHEALRGVAERFSLTYKDEPNATGSTYFLSLFSGDFRLICCLVPYPKAMVRKAHIRRFWGRFNFDPQRSFSFDGQPESDYPSVNGHRLAILLHGARGRRRDEPAFADMAIPNDQLNRYVERLALFPMFTETVEQARALLKRRRGRAEGTGA